MSDRSCACFDINVEKWHDVIFADPPPDAAKLCPEAIFGFDCYPVRRCCFYIADAILKKAEIPDEERKRLQSEMYEAFGFD